MKFRPAWKKGAILLQTLVMSILLSMIAIMIMKWVLTRYTMVGHMHRSITSNTRGQGWMSYRFCNSNWQTSGISASNISLDNPPKYFALTVSGTASGTSVQTVRVVTEQDQ
ncbi:MAG: hypothetical protein A3J79_08885 [Elusimicrobia bacterium RIFOXYB2_FULL_62_6]|nr:MAG: hypothetical protein A3J79_08885 [Elusimicrobia bacterium RIFOXYB2_FULL_62_6]